MNTRLLLLSLVLATGCDGAAADERVLELTFMGNGQGTIHATVSSLTGQDEPTVIECSDTCAVFAPVDSIVELVPTAAPGANFLGWNRNHLDDSCSGTGVCDFLLYDGYELEVDFSSTRAVLEVDKLSASNLPITYAGASVSYNGRTGDGQCSGSTCLFVVDVGAAITLAADDSYNNVRWHETGTCDNSNVQCVVPLSDEATVDVTVEHNKWLGVSLEARPAP